LEKRRSRARRPGRRPARVTIRDVAGRLGLSITTVSRALDGYGDVAAATRARVRRAAAEMGYSPSGAARRLRRRLADALGYILPAGGERFADPFFSQFIAGLGDEVTSQGFDLLVSTAMPDSPAERELYTRWASGRLVDGVVLSRMRLRDWRVTFLARTGLPFVAHGRTALRHRFPYIEMDSRGAFAELVAHLAAAGHRRIAYIGAPDGITLQAERFAGYRDGLAAAGIEADPALAASGDLTRSGGYEAALRLLELPEPPTAIVGVNDLTAIGAMRAAHEKGLRVGADLAVAGYDGTEDSAHTQPPLTTLEQPTYDTARRLVRMLVAVIRGEALAEPRIIIKPRLIPRGSTSGWKGGVGHGDAPSR
jgi:LacI family transcriptional regulator